MIGPYSYKNKIGSHFELLHVNSFWLSHTINADIPLVSMLCSKLCSRAEGPSYSPLKALNVNKNGETGLIGYI